MILNLYVSTAKAGNIRAGLAGRIRVTWSFSEGIAKIAVRIALSVILMIQSIADGLARVAGYVLAIVINVFKCIASEIACIAKYVLAGIEYVRNGLSLKSTLVA